MLPTRDRLPAVLVIAPTLLMGTACGPGGLPRGHTATPPKLDASSCKAGGGSGRPLVVEWPQADRADLESASRRGLVAVRYSGCEVQLLTRCRIAGRYDFTRVSPMNEEVRIRNSDELWANLPVGAASLEGKLAQAGELRVGMTVAGKMSSELEQVSRDQLAGDCGAATHFVSALTVGAFELSAGAQSEIAGGVSVIGVGAGAKTASSKEVLTTAGDRASCASYDPTSLSPADGCRAVIRIEVAAIGPARPPSPKTCPETMALLPERNKPETYVTGDWAKIIKRDLGVDCLKTPKHDLCYSPPLHVPSFCIDRNSVTAAEYLRCVESGKCNADHVRCDPQATFQVQGRERHPMNCVDFYQAEAYCKAAGKRLPTPDEFGWAQASAREGGRAPWGDRYPEKGEIWTSVHDEQRTGTLPVGSTPLSDTLQGVRDLFGNVKHWSDRYISQGGGVYAAGLGYSYRTTKESVMGVGVYSPVKPGAYGPEMGFRCAMVAR